jgi:hypothetical protein
MGLASFRAHRYEFGVGVVLLRGVGAIVVLGFANVKEDLS